MRRAWEECLYDACAFERGSNGYPAMKGSVHFVVPHYVAHYEDAARAKASACSAGYTGAEGQSWYDFIDISLAKYRTCDSFDSLEDAERWLVAEIRAEKSCFGTGTIIHYAQPKSKCRECTCLGFWVDHEYSVNESGIIEDNVLESPCDDEVA